MKARRLPLVLALGLAALGLASQAHADAEGWRF
ncbi:hypothetical protein DFP85_11131 [Halomonas ventosae]|uniref:Uncharacterized protein n=1 Tax=Halomonas ventosae TaxID=229007 RepID=A0A4R6ZK07_9GAMM|nr:hypothetical protein DFP85_11131 [Halomonas ventosae]